MIETLLKYLIYTDRNELGAILVKSIFMRNTYYGKKNKKNNQYRFFSFHWSFNLNAKLLYSNFVTYIKDWEKSISKVDQAPHGIETKDIKKKHLKSSDEIQRTGGKN